MTIRLLFLLVGTFHLQRDDFVSHCYVVSRSARQSAPLLSGCFCFVF